MKKIVMLTVLCFSLVFSLYASDWSGRYIWVISTDKDNGGKMASLEFVVKETKEEWRREIYLVDKEKEYRLSPLILPTDDSFSLWHKYKEDSEAGETFRVNNKKINTSPFVPGKWMIYQIETTENESITTMKVSAFNFKVDVKITFSFSLDENGKEQLTFWMDTDLSLADGMFFKNPEPESNGRFVLVKQ